MFALLTYDEIILRLRTVCSSVTVTSAKVTFNASTCNAAQIGGWISAYDDFFSGTDLAKLSNCPDADAYGDLVLSLLWGHVSPLLLTFTAVRIILRIVHQVYKDV